MNQATVNQFFTWNYFYLKFCKNWKPNQAEKDLKAEDETRARKAKKERTEARQRAKEAKKTEQVMLCNQLEMTKAEIKPENTE